MMSLALAAQLLQQGGGACTVHGAVDPSAVGIARVHSDSRSVEPGDLFVALVGERFDAHAFVQQAHEAGAAAALVQTGRVVDALPCLEVPDTHMALKLLARQWRQRFDIPVIAVTGSNGKTTVTQMLAAILRAAFGQNCLATQGNLNNDIGLPLMVLRLRPQHRAAVFELGMNHPGEIAVLADIAQPTVALINNAQREHQEFMRSVQAVAEENGSVITALPPQGVAVFPAGDVHTALWHRLAAGRCVRTFGTDAQADATIGQAVWKETQGQAGWVAEMVLPGGAVWPVQLAVAGRHNLVNALAAAVTARAAGIGEAAIVQGLEAFRPVKGRGMLHRVLHDDGTWQWVIDDSYNANPDSVRAAIDVLMALPAPRLLVLGDMGEVGDEGASFHTEVGVYAKSCGIDGVWTLGELAAHTSAAFGPGAHHYTDMAALCQALDAQATALASVLVKGSRFMRMERALEHLLHALQVQGGRVQP